MKQSDQEEGKPKRRFSEEQYQMLLRCSKKKDMTEWNEWRKTRLPRPEDGCDCKANPDVCNPT